MYSNHKNSPLPYGWVKETHNESGHPYFVDTKATPPRSIWVHPYDNDQYLREHPNVRKKVYTPGNSSSQGVSIGSKNGHRNPSQASSTSSITSEKHAKRGLLGKLKDKAIATKEARQAEKRHHDQLRAQQQQERMAAQAAYMQQQQHAMPYGQQQRMGGMGGMGGMGRRGGGMGGMALPLVGGMAGGLLLGDMLDGGLNDNNYGGDGFGDGGGGDFGGGDFGGGF